MRVIIFSMLCFVSMGSVNAENCHSALADAYKNCPYTSTGQGNCNQWACGQISQKCQKEESYWCG